MGHFRDRQWPKSGRFEKKVSRDHYASVDIRWEHKSIATCKVELVH